MLKNAVKLEYDVDKFPFAKVLALLVFKTRELKDLHLSWQKKTGKNMLDYEDNLHLRGVMQKLNEESPFYKLYHHWIRKVVSPHYGHEITYSAHPKMRVHLAGTGSVSGFHRDVDVTKRELQINCYLPFTHVFDTNTLWCETEYGLKDYQPINLQYGEALLWDGGYLSHGTVANETSSTRVSCDFRFQPKAPQMVRAPWSGILAGRTSELSPGECSETQMT